MITIYSIDFLAIMPPKKYIKKTDLLAQQQQQQPIESLESLELVEHQIETQLPIINSNLPPPILNNTVAKISYKKYKKTMENKNPDIVNNSLNNSDKQIEDTIIFIDDSNKYKLLDTLIEQFTDHINNSKILLSNLKSLRKEFPENK